MHKPIRLASVARLVLVSSAPSGWRRLHIKFAEMTDALRGLNDFVIQQIPPLKFWASIQLRMSEGKTAPCRMRVPKRPFSYKASVIDWNLIID